MKYFLYPHKASLLLLLLGAGWLSTPIRSTAASPDSLLRMPVVERFLTLSRQYQKISRADTAGQKEYIEELTRFFEEEGTEEDRLVFEVSRLPKDKDDPKLIPVFSGRTLLLLKQAEAQKHQFLTAKIHQCLAMFYYNIQHDYGLAFRHYFRMYELIKDMDEATFPDRNYAIYLLARAYYDFFDYENAIMIGDVLKNVKPGSEDKTHVFNACLVGMSYLRLGRHAEARREFEWALRQLPFMPLNNTAWVGILSGDIGLSFFEQKKYDEGIPYLQKGLDLCTQTELWDNASGFGVKLARIELERQQPQRALVLARRTLDIARRIRDPIQPMGLYMMEPYQLMSDCSRALGLYTEAMLYADSAALANKQWHKVRDVAQKHKAEIAMELERHEMRQALLENEKERQLLIRNGLLTLLLLGFIIAVLLYNRQNLKDRHRQQQVLAQKQQAEAELAYAMAQLHQYRQSYREKSELITKVEKEWESGVADALPDPVRQQTLSALHQSVLLTDDDWVTFVDLLEKVHPGFLYRLRIKLPTLSPAETRYLTLYKLGYTSLEMAAMLGVGLGAIRQSRLRIRRKFSVADDTEIEQLVAVI